MLEILNRQLLVVYALLCIVVVLLLVWIFVSCRMCLISRDEEMQSLIAPPAHRQKEGRRGIDLSLRIRPR